MNRANLLFVASCVTLIGGIYTTALSFLANSSILAVVGLGLIFWGIIFALIKEENSVRKSLVDAAVISSTSALNAIIKELGVKGMAVYMPPQYLLKPGDNLVCLLKETESILPTVDEIRRHAVIAVPFDTGSAVVLTPTGNELTRLLERVLRTSLVEMNMNDVRDRLPRVMVENLEMVEKMEIEVDGESVVVKLVRPFLGGRHWEESSLSDSVRPSGNPLSSALACVFAKASAHPTIVKSWHLSADAETVEIRYSLLETPKVE